MNIEMLEKYAPGYKNLHENEKSSVLSFIMLWTIFEARALDTYASASKVVDKVKEWNDRDLLTNRWFEDSLEYFQTRYVDPQTGEFNNRFTSLNFRKYDKQDLIKAVLKKENECISDQLTACLIIVYRFRNNLFHGVKWAYEMRDQQENFEHSIKLMQDCLDRVLP